MSHSVSFNPAVTVVEGDLTRDLLTIFTESGIVAVDLETSGLDWRVDSIATVQLYSAKFGTVIIRALHERPNFLSAVLSNAEVVKIFHHAPFDLSFLVSHWSLTAKNVRCTKIASKLAEPTLPSAQHSLGSLAQRMLGVNLDKGEVRVSNWFKSALSAEQVEYAANDVRFLPSLLIELERRLKEAGRLSLYRDCCHFLQSWSKLETENFPDPFSY